jgi:hypothetical protein
VLYLSQKQKDQYQLHMLNKLEETGYMVDAKTSNQTFFRGVKLTKTTEKKIVIK